MRRYARTLVAVALATTVVAGTAGWVSGDAQAAVTGPPPGSASWRADHTRGQELPDPGRATPGEVARFFRGLGAAEQQRLVVRHPLVVGNLDGVPVELRYRANALSLRAADDPRYRSLATPGRRILAFDPRGRGQVAEVFGDLRSARRVSVVVPGSDIDAGTFDRTNDVYGTPAGMARSLYAQSGAGTAVVAWAGYTTPVGVGLDAATGGLAEAGAERLTRFAEGLTADGLPEPAVFCHSYGSVVCGLAAPRLRATDLVVIGSPGMRADDVGDLRTRARVWAAKDATDWIDDVPNVEFAGLGHGSDPADPRFGARRVPAEDAEGHTGYFVPGTDSLRALAAIADGAERTANTDGAERTAVADAAPDGAGRTAVADGAGRTAVPDGAGR
ncbi:alpha/beta hydrolase family protein [Streptomyces sp. NBC_00654]|uniref:alpha/beta hydrolase n=1 Tax=Streptomyces sp. NBC_00654 TaxID=2975799 RepID=UPI0022522A26|nr:alpha/beta hydrolase [Streptomyces sp. NBC_00654]MCX4969102.1 alpha/beta hydrolase family protein [Streptomyces sp. NBC_00654]